MDELLSVFIETYFSEESQESIHKCFGLFEFYEYNQAFSGFIDIANMHGNVSSDTLKDQFTSELHSKLDYVLEQHTIKMVDTATIENKIEILTSLAHIQNLEDYSGIARTLETFASDEEQLASILSESTLMDETEIMTLISEFSPSLLVTLKKFVEIKEQERANANEPHYDVIKNMRLFCQYSSDNTVGAVLSKSGILLGDRFETYLNYTADAFEELLQTNKSPDTLAANFLSILYLSVDGLNSPLLVYRKYSLQLLKDLQLVGEVEVKLLEHISKFTEYKKVEHEKTKLS